MTSLANKMIEPLAVSVTIKSDKLIVGLDDGRELAVPLDWYPRLANGTLIEQGNWQLIPPGNGIHWPDLDEDISIAGLLAGQRSMESQISLSNWLSSRES